MAKEIKFFKPPRTDAQYLKRPGECPFCGFDQVEGEGVDINEGHSSQEVTCQRCFASWYDEYKLSGYSVINGPEATEEPA